MEAADGSLHTLKYPLTILFIVFEEINAKNNLDA